MRSLSTELKVGFFALFVIAILGFMTFKISGIGWMKKEGYFIHVYFKNIAGLDEKTKVKIAGVNAGVIEKIQLSEGRAKLTVRMSKDIILYEDASASIKASGLLGDKYLDIKPGFQKPVVKNGDTIKNVVEIVDLDDLTRNLTAVSENINTLAKSFNESFSTEDSKYALKESLMNIRDITVSLKDAISVNDKKLRDTLDNINSLTASINDLIQKNKDTVSTAASNIKDFSASLKQDGPQLIAKLNKAADELKAMVEENRPAIKSATESINSIANKIDRGEGSLGKLVKDDSLYKSVNKAAEGIEKTVSAVERFRTFITFQGDYLSDTSEGKGYFYLTLQPKPDKYYILGVVGDPLGKTTTTETKTITNGVEVREKEYETKKRIEFTAQYAQRFSDLALRIGLTENTFGAGADYFFNNDKGKITADIWDISNDEEDSKSPHVRAGVDYFIFKNVFISAGVDNIFNDKWRSVYAGGGVKFEDEDLKYLFGTLPRISP
jgi:phospholipid/cholesterol/gamma-HCH transport system substrate-binding protein